MTEHDSQDELTRALERDLLERYGPLIGHDDLCRALGYASMDAFRQALVRRSVPVPVITLPNRRGKFALSRDVAAWLAGVRRDALRGAGVGPTRMAPGGDAMS